VLRTFSIRKNYEHFEREESNDDNSTLACASLFSFWSAKAIVSASIHKAEAQTRVYVGPLYRGGYSLPWHAVRAYTTDNAARGSIHD
jgi:hypothetical protein